MYARPVTIRCKINIGPRVLQVGKNIGDLERRHEKIIAGLRAGRAIHDQIHAGITLVDCRGELRRRPRATRKGPGCNRLVARIVPQNLEEKSAVRRDALNQKWSCDEGVQEHEAGYQGTRVFHNVDQVPYCLTGFYRQTRPSDRIAHSPSWTSTCTSTCTWTGRFAITIWPPNIGRSYACDETTTTSTTVQMEFATDTNYPRLA